MFYDHVLRPLLFQCPPEFAHDLAKLALKTGAPWKLLGAKAASPRLQSRLGALRIANPIGLSAGFDKNAEALAGLSQLGFGYLTIGSMLPTPRSGNPKPRLLRLPEQESLLNCYGLPSDGLERSLPRLARWSRSAANTTPIIANIDCPDVDTYLRVLAKVEPFVAGVEIGTQCPNNQDDNGEFNTRDALEKVLAQAAQFRRKPLFVKLLPYGNEAERQNRLELAELAAHYQVDGICLPGTWRVPTEQLSLGYGQASGRMVFEKTLETVKDLATVTRGKIAIKANGGISTGEEVFRVLAAGASSADILAGFIYRGWGLPRKAQAELLAQLDAHHLHSVTEIGPHLLN
ncbi:MAG: dihydroorotate dehydrogenase 2 [Pigmentiphaga sp.]|nr:dihydroorotate dehydrogenase 2 [Pigmentiphaga sp.]